jgi:hypothetical protein
MQNFLRNHSRLIQTPLIYEGSIKKRYIKYYSVLVLIFFLTACATTLPPMQPLTGDITEEKIVASEVKYRDEILVFHKTQGQMPIRFARVNQEYLFFFSIDEAQNLDPIIDGKIHLKDIDRIGLIRRNIESSEGVQSEFWENYWKTLKNPRWSLGDAVGKIMTGILLFALMIALIA